jgi:hypothetical protein
VSAKTVELGITSGKAQTLTLRMPTAKALACDQG